MDVEWDLKLKGATQQGQESKRPEHRHPKERGSKACRGDIAADFTHEQL